MQRLVYIVRHGTTDWNRGGYIQGHLDTPLNAEGRTQAEAAGGRLVTEGAAVIYSSDLLRVYETAQIIARHTGLRVIQKPGLREMHFGQWQGLSFDQIKRRDPEIYAARRERPFEVPPPGGETWMAFYQRSVDALQEILAATDAQRLIVATHSGVCTALGLAALGLGPTGKRTFGNANCAIHTIGVTGDQWEAVSLNATDHLPSTPC